MSEPIYEHDCDRCVFIWRAGGMDWYICPSTVAPKHSSILGRYGDEGDNYYSCLRFEDRPSISSAMALAQATWLKWREQQQENG